MVTARDALASLESAAARGALDPLCDRLGVDLLGAFGSATVPGTEPRDLDLAVRFVGPLHVLDLLDALVELTGYDAIDLVILDGEHPVLDAEGLCGVPLFERARGRFAEAQMAAMAIRRDTAWLRKLDLDRLAG